MNRPASVAALLLLCSAAHAQVTPVQRFSDIFKEWYYKGFPWNQQSWFFWQLGQYSIPMHSTFAGSAGASGVLEAPTGTDPVNIWWGVDNRFYFSFEVTTPILARLHGTLNSVSASPFAAFVVFEGPNVELLINLSSGLMHHFDQSIPLDPGIYEFEAHASSLYGSTSYCSNTFALEFSTCYSNCDHSTQSPILNIADFSCFLQKFAAAEPYANCDSSTIVPILNVADFSCFLQKFAAGCP